MSAVRSERGAVTLLAVAMTGVLLLLGSALGVVASMVAAHRAAQSAADLAALAGAAAAQHGAAACGAATEIARRNGAELIACDVAGTTVTVGVRVDGPHWLGQQSDLEARSRAGPA